MIVYLWDEDGSPAGTMEVEEGGAYPERSTLQRPPDAVDGMRVCWFGGAWHHLPIPVPELADLKASLTARATAMRWQEETGGVLLGGTLIATGIEDQNRIASVLASPLIDDMGAIDFKSASGWVTLTAPELRAIASAITGHVQGCFSRERARHEAIDALTTIDDALDYRFD